VRTNGRWIAGAAAVLAALIVAPAGVGADSARRVIDYTAVCRMLGEGYPDATRFMTVSASARPPLFSMSNGPRGDVRVFLATGATGRSRTGSLIVNRTECAPSPLKLRFSTKGLREGPATHAVRSHTCDVPSAVLVRVRATFRRPTGFRRDPLAPWLARAEGGIGTAYLAVATLSGRRPLVYASVDDGTRRSRLFVSPTRCRQEQQ
jgi:hypothetical protein